MRTRWRELRAELLIALSVAVLGSAVPVASERTNDVGRIELKDWRVLQ